MENDKLKKIVIAIVTLLISILITAVSCALGVGPSDIVDLPEVDSSAFVALSNIPF